jgi:hypothetical protein
MTGVFQNGGKLPFDKLRANEKACPFALSLSKGKFAPKLKWAPYDLTAQRRVRHAQVPGSIRQLRGVRHAWMPDLDTDHECRIPGCGTPHWFCGRLKPCAAVTSPMSRWP